MAPARPGHRQGRQQRRDHVLRRYIQRSSRSIGFVEPCLPSSAKTPPAGPNWLHEIKHDGFHILPRRDATR
jgi:ATP-dependent DNA ligase